MPLIDCSIQLDDPEICFSGGDEVTGQVLIDRKTDRSRARLFFEAYEKSDIRDVKQIVVYDSYQVPLTSREDDLHNERLEEADLDRVRSPRNRLRFSLVLPRGIPSSVEDKRGRICYILKVALQFQADNRIPSDEEAIAITEIPVGGSYSRAFVEQLRVPSHAECRRKLMQLSPRPLSSELVLTLNLKKRVFFRGETLSASIKITNNSNKTFSKQGAIFFQLRRFTEFHYWNTESNVHIDDPSSKERLLAVRYTSKMDLEVGPRSTQEQDCHWLVPKDAPSTVLPMRVIVDREGAYSSLDGGAPRILRAGVLVNVLYDVKVRIDIGHVGLSMRHLSVKLPVILLHRVPFPQNEPVYFMKDLRRIMPDFGTNDPNSPIPRIPIRDALSSANESSSKDNNKAAINVEWDHSDNENNSDPGQPFGKGNGKGRAKALASKSFRLPSRGGSNGGTTEESKRPLLATLISPRQYNKLNL